MVEEPPYTLLPEGDGRRLGGLPVEPLQGGRHDRLCPRASVQALPYRMLTGLVRMVQRRPDLHTLIGRVHSLVKDHPALRPIGLARDARRTVGWRWEHPWRLG